MARHSVTCDQLEISLLLDDPRTLPVWLGVDRIGAQTEDDAEPDDEDDDDDDEEDDEEEDDDEEEEA